MHKCVAFTSDLSADMLVPLVEILVQNKGVFYMSVHSLQTGAICMQFTSDSLAVPLPPPHPLLLPRGTHYLFMMITGW
jgi:hypothetical protein